MNDLVIDTRGLRKEFGPKIAVADLTLAVRAGEVDVYKRQALAYARLHNVPVTQTEKSIYSRDANMWHLSHEGGILEDPANEPEEAMYQLSVSPESAPDKAEIVEIAFEQGMPVAVNGVQLLSLIHI